MTEFLKLLGITSATMIAVGTVVGFFGKYVISYIYDGLIERMKKKTAEELEAYKSTLEEDRRSFQHKLDIRLDRYKVQFSKLHEERAHIIKEMHSKLLELHIAIRDYIAIARWIEEGVDPKDAEENRIKRANEALNNFNNYAIENSIYFEKTLADKLNAIRREYFSTALEYSHIKQFPARDMEGYTEQVKRWQAINEKVSGDLHNALNEMEDEFRKLLGVN